MTAVYFSRMYPGAELACVEPVPDNLRVLAENLRLNGLRAVLFAAAVDVQDGRVIMDLHPMDYGHKISDAQVHSKYGTFEVDAVSIETILERVGWSRIGLLKVDVEGHERALFGSRCEWLNRVDNICIECHGDFGEADLRRLAERFSFSTPTRLEGVWFLTRDEPWHGRQESAVGASQESATERH